MAMIDSFFSKGFKAAKCKTLLKLTIPRIKLLRNRREIQLKQMRREIAKLLETGQEATARIRVEHIIREEKMMAAQEILELFCELIAVRLPIIEAQRECPLDLKEAISSVCFAAPRCADLPELIQVQMSFAGKYGKEFVASATELRPECGVNRQLIELLSIRAPSPDVKLKLLKEIAEEHELDWDPSASESELLKPHEDLLNGSAQFVSASKTPLPEEKHDEAKPTSSEPEKETDSEEDYDIIDFPEVPTQQPLQSNKNPVSVPVMLPFPESALSDEDESNPSPHLVEDKQFVPFISPPSQPSVSFPVKEQNQNPPRSTANVKNDNMDLQDVLAAAQEAAESAERAAAAARSAASLAQLRVSELVRRKNDEVSGSNVENPFHGSGLEEKAELDSRASSCSSQNISRSSSQNISRNNSARPLYDDATTGDFDFDLSPHGGLHQPQRLPSMDDETYFSHPNLFNSQGSNK